MYWLASKYPTSVAKLITKNCSKLRINSTKKLPTWGRGVSKIQKVANFVYGSSLMVPGFYLNVIKKASFGTHTH